MSPLTNTILPNAAPDGCTQYFTSSTGTIQSYNFAGGRHIANQEVVHCIRTNANQCQIAYTQSTFSVSHGASTPAFQTGDACTIDFIIVPDGFTGTTPTTTIDRYCGTQLGDANMIVRCKYC